MAASEICLAALDQIPPGEGRTFLVDGQQIAVFHTHGEGVYATQSHCPHLNGPLADGLVGGASVMCPLHDRIYDLKTGCGLTHEHHAIATYPVRVAADGTIWLDPVAQASRAPAEG